ncbi:MAG: extracellular solute-binding protein, partial [Armatimonadota bacterium]
AYGGGGSWGDTFDPTLLKMGQFDGKQYMLPFYLMLYGWWYDPGVFAKNGWTPPKNYAELLTLCEKIKAKGIAPITFQGKYPYYMVEGMLMPWAYSVGGADAIKACQNMEPGAWKSPSILQAAKMIVELKDKGYFEQGATAMTHTESQTEFLQGKAAMIPCGTWLSSEMKSVMPPNAKMEFFLPPVVDGGKGDPTMLIVGIEPWMVPAKAKNPSAGIEFFRYMTSLDKAKQFVREKGTLMAIKGSEQTELPEVLKKPAEAYKGAKDVWSVMYKLWYPSFETELENSLTSLVNGQSTPEQFCDRVEAAADKVRKDSAITKHKL